MLSPIDKIEIDFGKPTDFTPPATRDVSVAAVKEAQEAEEKDNRFDLYAYAAEVWEKSLTSAEVQEYSRLQAEEKAAQDRYDPYKDTEKSEAAQAYFKANYAKERWMDAHGFHICFVCSYYTIPVEKTDAAGCFKLKKAVRPTCRACRHFTTDYTPEDREIDEKERIKMAAHPRYAEKVRREREKNSAVQIARRIDEGLDVVNFSSYERFPESYENAYKRFPEVFQPTKYPTIDHFKAAYTEFMKHHDTKTPDND